MFTVVLPLLWWSFRISDIDSLEVLFCSKPKQNPDIFFEYQPSWYREAPGAKNICYKIFFKFRTHCDLCTHVVGSARGFRRLFCFPVDATDAGMMMHLVFMKTVCHAVLLRKTK